MLLSFPVLSRIYEPEMFGVQSIYISCVMIFVPLSCLRFDVALVVEKDDVAAKSLLFISLCIAALISFIVYLLFKGVFSFFHITNDLENIELVIVLIGLNIFLEALLLSSSKYAIRNDKFKFVAVADITKTIVIISFAFIVGLSSSAKSENLIYAYYFGTLLSCIVYIPLLIELRDLKMSKKSLWRLALLQKDFVTYGSVGNIFNSLAMYLPNVFVGLLYGKEALGYFSTVSRFLKIPANIMGTSLAHSFFAETKNMAPCKTFIIQAERVIAYMAIAVTPLIVVAPISEQLLTIVLGDQWKGIGDYFCVLLFFYVMWTFTTPLSSIFNTLNKQKLLCITQLGKLIVRLLSLYLAHLYFDTLAALLVYSVFSGCMQLFQIDRSYRLIDGKRSQLLSTFLKLILPSLMAAILMSFMQETLNIFWLCVVMTCFLLFNSLYIYRSSM